jgi:hypothetical protein
MGKTRVELDDAILEQVKLKRDEYGRLQEYGRCPIGQWNSVPRIIEYAIQLIGWIDTNPDDDAVKSILERFKYQTKIRQPGRPKGVDKLDDISSMNVQVATYRLRTKGVYAPTRKEVREEFNIMVATGEVHTAEDSRKGKSDRAKQKEKLKNDASVQRLDETTKKMSEEKERPASRDWLDENGRPIRTEKIQKTKSEEQEDLLKELFGPAGDA